MKKTNEKELFKGIIFDIHETTFETSKGDFNAHVIKHPGAVVVAATHNDKDFYVVDQYRFATERVMTEFPAGKRDAGESPLESAIRELREETGYLAHTIVPLGSIHSSPAILDEELFMYYATDLEFIAQDLDDDEELDVYLMSLDELEAQIMDDTITDAKTLALLLKLKHYLKRKEG